MDNDPSRILGSLERPSRSSLEEHAELVRNLGDLKNISVRQTCTGLADVPTTGIGIGVAEEVPVGDGVCSEVGVLLNVGNTVEVVGIQLISRDEKATRFLQDPPRRVGIKGTVLLTAVQIQAQAGTEAHRTNDRPIRGSILRKMSIP